MHAARTLRPATIKQAVSRGREGQRDPHLREFLDEFYIEESGERRAAMLAEEPEVTNDARFDAYVAAMAEHLAFRHDLSVPGWCGGKGRFLARAYFPCGLESLKATYLVESPTAFRRRMIFVEADPLYRPRRAEPPVSPFSP